MLDQNAWNYKQMILDKWSTIENKNGYHDSQRFPSEPNFGIK